jgi:uncharacterized membrane protein
MTMEWTTGGHMGLMAVWWIIIFAALAAVVWFVIAAGRGRGSGDLSAEQQLKRRYAAGEIDRATYQRMLEDLRR